MQEIVKRNKCSGCSACYNICPVSCIAMKYDGEGFAYPVINHTKCLDCGLCKKICPVNNNYSGNPVGIAYACINKDDKIRLDSSSGGVFTEIAKSVINRNGVVFGAAFDENFDVKHICVSEITQLYKLRGSKYVQSTVGSTYKEIKAFLDEERLVLFSGTPCQIGGLKSYLGRDFDNLITVDFICHGVPSPKAWRKYLRYQQDNLSAKITEESTINFRDKSSGWYKFSMRINFDKEKQYLNDLSKDLFMRSFLSNLCLRPSCYNCHSKSTQRQSDVTLADFWGVKEQLPEMFDNKGTSLVLVNSQKGRRLFDEISQNMIVSEVDFDKAIESNIAAYKSCKMPKTREKFMSSLDVIDFKTNVENCTKPGVVNRIKRLIKRCIKYV